MKNALDLFFKWAKKTLGELHIVWKHNVSVAFVPDCMQHIAMIKSRWLQIPYLIKLGKLGEQSKGLLFFVMNCFTCKHTVCQLAFKFNYIYFVNSDVLVMLSLHCANLLYMLSTCRKKKLSVLLLYTVYFTHDWDIFFCLQRRHNDDRRMFNRPLMHWTPEYGRYLYVYSIYSVSSRDDNSENFVHKTL